MKKIWTPLHEAAKHSQTTTVRRLLAEGAHPNVREPGDNTYPLHWAAASGSIQITEALLDAGGDVHGRGDVHKLDVIGWATVFNKRPNKRLIRLLLDRGAHHHIFSAMALGDVHAIRELARR